MTLDPARGRPRIPVAVDRLPHRFGGEGTITTLPDGRAFTAAHCLAAVDGRRGVVVGRRGAEWTVVRRWSPRGIDLAVLLGDATGGRVRPASRPRVAVGRRVTLVVPAGTRMRTLEATVLDATSRRAIAEVHDPRGVCADDSGGPVLLGRELVGVVTHRTGPATGARCSAHVVFTRIDSPQMRRTVARAFARSR